MGRLRTSGRDAVGSSPSSLDVLRTNARGESPTDALEADLCRGAETTESDEKKRSPGLLLKASESGICRDGGRARGPWIGPPENALRLS